MSAIDAIVKIIGLDDYHLASRPAVFVCCFVSSVGTWFHQFIMNNLCRFLGVVCSNSAHASLVHVAHLE